MDLSLQVIYSHSSIFYQKEEWLSPVGTRLLVLEFYDSEKQISPTLDL